MPLNHFCINYLVLFEVEKSVSHLRNDMIMLNFNNRQINKQLCQNKECIQDHQTYHHHLEKSRRSDVSHQKLFPSGCPAQNHLACYTLELQVAERRGWEGEEDSLRAFKICL